MLLVCVFCIERCFSLRLGYVALAQTNRSNPSPPYQQVMSHIWMSHGTHMNELWHTYEWVMAHIWMSHGTRMNESWHTYEWVMAHIWMSHGTHMTESWHTYEWVMAHVWRNRTPYKRVTSLIWMSHGMSHGTHMNESWHTYDWVTQHVWVSHAAHVYLPRRLDSLCVHLWPMGWHAVHVHHTLCLDWESNIGFVTQHIIRPVCHTSQDKWLII